MEGRGRGVTFCKPAAGAPAAAVRRRLAVLVVVSRFLKFAILNREKSFRIWTLVPTPRAPLCMGAGGYMKGAGRQKTYHPSEPLRAAWEGRPAKAGPPSRRSDRCVFTQFRPRCSCADPYGDPGGNAASVASLTRSLPAAPAEGRLRAAAKGAEDAVLNPEGWALWVTGLCLPLLLKASGGPRSAEFYDEAARNASSWSV